MASEETMSSTIEETPTAVSNGYRNYVLCILTLIYAFNFIDRQIIGILSPFIKADLGLDDAQLGWLKGLYFALLYTVLGIPIAWLADRYSRVNIVAISLTLWSGFTAASGLATNFTQLALARIGVGIGEAGGSPPSHSIISDLFPKEKRAGALAIYSMGIPFGIMFAFFASAFFLKGGEADWRIVMIAVGLPGVALALLLKLTVKEPPRSGNMQTASAQNNSWQSIKALLSIKSWWGMCFAISFGSFGNYAISTWMIDFYVRAHAGLDITQFLITLGIINGTAYAGGVWLGTVQQGTPMTGSITGLTGAAPAWNAIMSEALNGVNPGTFDSPSGVVSDTVCQLTGTLAPQATANCPTRVTEIFLQTQPPPAADAGFAITININSWNGLRANQWCAENVVTETFANVNDTGAINWLTSTAQGQQILSALNLPASLQAPPAGECEQGQILPTVLINFPQENTELLGNVAITGQVNANELQRWELQISEVGTDNFRSIMPQARTDQVLNSGLTLYEWDSRTVQNGAYILRLAAYSTSGGFIFRDVRVTVQNPEPTPTPIPATAIPLPVITTPLPFDTLPSATPDTFNNP